MSLYRLMAVLFIFVLLGGVWQVSSASSETPSTPQAMPPYPGFPREEPKGRLDWSSPVVVDINQDGQLDILVGDNSGCIWAFNRQGAVLPGFPLISNGTGNCDSGGRIGGPLAVGDVDGNDNGLPEIVAGTRETTGAQAAQVWVWENTGVLKWTRGIAWNGSGFDIPEVKTVALGNLTGNANLEVVAGTTNNNCLPDCSQNLYAWDGVGNLLSNFPQGGQDAGIYGGVAVGNITGGAAAEIVTGRDHRWLYAYDAGGNALPGWPHETFISGNSGPYAEFTNNAPNLADLDHDGTLEIIIAGKIKFNSVEIGSTVMVLEPNGTRRAGWQTAPTFGAPLYGDFPPSMAPALADLDKDGKLEIIVAMFDGVLRVFRENGNLLWQYNFAQGVMLYGSEPVVGDINGDGQLDIVFGTYSPNKNDATANAAVRIIGLDRNGNLLPNFPIALTAETGSSGYFGVRAGLTLIDFDNNKDLELMAASMGGSLYVWDLPNAPSPCTGIPWPTARHDNARSGVYPDPNPPASLTVPAVPYTTSVIYLPIVFKCN